MYSVDLHFDPDLAAAGGQRLRLLGYNLVTSARCSLSCFAEGRNLNLPVGWLVAADMLGKVVG